MIFSNLSPFGKGNYPLEFAHRSVDHMGSIPLWPTTGTHNCNNNHLCNSPIIGDYPGFRTLRPRFPNKSLLLFQGFMATVTTTALVLAALRPAFEARRLEASTSSRRRTRCSAGRFLPPSGCLSQSPSYQAWVMPSVTLSLKYASWKLVIGLSIAEVAVDDRPAGQVELVPLVSTGRSATTCRSSPQRRSRATPVRRADHDHVPQIDLLTNVATSSSGPSS